jgi:hypothetical protein
LQYALQEIHGSNKTPTNTLLFKNYNQGYQYLGAFSTGHHITTEINQGTEANKKRLHKKTLTELETPDLMLHKTRIRPLLTYG